MNDRPLDATSRAPSPWPVYGVTLLLVPGAIWLGACLHALIALTYALIRLAKGEIFAGDIGPVANTFIADVLAQGAWPIAIGVFANSGLFGSVALGLSMRDGERNERGERGLRRLRLHHGRISDAIIALLGLLALTSSLDAIVQLAGLEQYGRLAEMKSAIATLSIPERVLLSVVVGLGAGTAEELYFRGYMMTRLELAHGRWPGLLITSVVFGLFHLDPVHSPLAGLMGLYLGLSVILTGSLYTGILAHVANNVTATMLASVGPADTNAVIVAALGPPLAASALVWLKRRRGELRPAVW
jgi:membrane protease YdiL (CAAX protease family)